MIRSKPSDDQFRDGWDRIFGKKKRAKKKKKPEESALPPCIGSLDVVKSSEVGKISEGKPPKRKPKGKKNAKKD